MGSQRSDGRKFYDICGGKLLWQFVPLSMRGYWVEEISRQYTDGTYVYLNSNSNSNSEDVRHAYDGCSIDEPEPFFKDRTLEIDEFNSDIQSFDLKRLMNALDPGSLLSKIVPNVQCPWGCSEFCFKAAHCNLALLIQNHLRELHLNFPIKDWYKHICFVESSRWDYIRGISGRSMILLNKDWEVWPSVSLDRNEGLVALTCRHHKNYASTKRLYTHVPKKPHHNLSAEKCDQLSPCVVQPRTAHPMRAAKYNVVPGMNLQCFDYSGMDSMTIKTEGCFQSFSPMLGFHETLSIAGRTDINCLLEKNQIEGIMIEDLVDNLRESTRVNFPTGSLDEFRQGCTYIPVEDAVNLQLDISGDRMIKATRKRKIEGNHFVEDDIICPRTWSPIINYVQMEDSFEYGYPMKAIDRYHNVMPHMTSMMTWATTGLIIGSKDLWSAMDRKLGLSDLVVGKVICLLI
jgi:hypothetical protein